jgi:hypothetical protein
MIDLWSTSTRRSSFLATAAALLIGASPNGHAQSPEAALPPLPPEIGRPAEYAFGDAVAQRDQRAWGPVFDALAQRFGKARLTVLRLTLAADADVGALRHRLDREMVERRRWRALIQEAGRPEAWTHGYASADGRHVLMLIGLRPRSGEVLVPLTIVTTLPGKA